MDPVLVLVSLSVLALVVGGITLAVMNAQKWGVTQAFDSVEQTSEDAARLAWMADVGTATQVLPAAKSGTTAKTSVRFDTTTREAAWPAAAQCRAVTWWLANTVMDPKSPNARDPQTGQPVPAVEVHRSIAYYAAAAADGSCVTTSAPLRPATNSTIVKNAQRGAQFSYVNGHLRDLVYPFAATPGRESCEGIAKGATANLTTCTNRSATKIVAQRTLWEWADPTPVQVLLEMTTDQAGMGKGYGTQIGWRELTGRRELVGDANSPVTDTLGNPPAPAAHTAGPATARVNTTTAPNDGSADYVTVRRTDTRDLDGFEYQCRETLRGVYQRSIPAGGNATDGAGKATVLTAMPTTTAMTIPGTKTGHAYTCYQRGWVNAVEAPNLGMRFAGGVSDWSPASAVATRRPAMTTVQGVLNADNTMTFTWAAQAGAESYEAAYRVNAGGEWVDISAQLNANSTSWRSAPQPADTRLYLRVRPVNAGGAPAYATTNVTRVFPAPVVSLEPGAVGKSTYFGSWPGLPDFNPAIHDYEVRYRQANSQGWTTVLMDATSVSLQGILPGRTVSYQVRALGVNAGNSGWSNVAASTRPVAQPAVPGVSMDTTVGTVWTSSTVATCEGGTTSQYNVWASGRGWRGWNEDRTASYGGSEGEVISVAWKARCVPGEGAIGPESGEGGGSARVPYTRPGQVSAYNSGSGYAGTNVTFSWVASGAGYFRVYNSAVTSLRYSGGGSAVTVGREAGATTARVYAFRSVAHYNAGVAEGDWTKYSTSDSTTASTTINPYPSAWGDAAGCPAIGVYVTPASPNTWQIRRQSTTTCQLRWRVTASGATPANPQGTVVGTGTLTLNSGASQYTRQSGASSLPMGPLVG